jgi:hypothetical protein
MVSFCSSPSGFLAFVFVTMKTRGTRRTCKSLLIFLFRKHKTERKREEREPVHEEYVVDSHTRSAESFPPEDKNCLPDAEKELLRVAHKSCVSPALLFSVCNVYGISTSRSHDFPRPIKAPCTQTSLDYQMMCKPFFMLQELVDEVSSLASESRVSGSWVESEIGITHGQIHDNSVVEEYFWRQN